MSHDETMMMIGMAGRTIDRYEEAIEQWAERVRQLEVQNSTLRAQVQKLRGELYGQLMRTAGLEAQRDHLKKLGPGAHTAWQPSGQFFSDGDPKTKLRLIYEAAFDAKGRELGVADPARCRVA